MLRLLKEWRAVDTVEVEGTDVSFVDHLSSCIPALQSISRSCVWITTAWLMESAPARASST